MTGMTASASPFSEEALESLLKSRSEPDWVLSERREAWERFQELEWPGRSEEEWRRTDLRGFKLDRFAPVRELSEQLQARSLPPGLLTAGVSLAGSLTSLDSVTLHQQLDERWSKRGVWFSSLDRLTESQWQQLRPHWERRIVDPRYDRFSSLTHAFWNGGQILYVPRGVVVDEPLHALTLLSSGGADTSRTLIVLEDGAEATALIETASLEGDGEGFHCGMTEVLVGRGAHLRVVNLQNWGHRVWHFAHQKALVERDATLQWTVAALGARLAKVNQEVGLVGEGASCQVNGVLFTEGTQHQSYHTLQHHEAPNCRSDFLYKAALQDRSRTVWRGMIKVDSKAQQTDGYQRNDNLLLSTQSRADSIPGLEIQADDVRCTHGSTSGRVDEELIFYARCRGFTRKEAIRAVVIGFFQQVFDRITMESVREALGSAIARRVREYD
jgi:Fe-S cluster assembly protein SufD